MVAGEKELILIQSVNIPGGLGAELARYLLNRELAKEQIN